MWCQECAQEVPIVGRVPFRERCPHCDAALHTCTNCKFFDAGSYNQCRENRAERQVEKRRENRCEYFQALPDPPTGEKKTGAGPKQSFEALFANSPTKGED
jgi:hypothetical protein